MAQLAVNGLAQGSQIALVATGFALIFAVTRTLHLAHGAIITLAAYLVWWLAATAGLPLVVAITVATLVASAVAAGHEALLYRPLRARSRSPLIIVVASLGSGIALQNIVAMALGYDTKNIRAVTVGSAQAGLSFGDVVVAPADLVGILIAVVLVLALEGFLRYTPLGRQIRAVQDNAQLADVMWLNASRVYTHTFIVGTAVSIPAAIFIGMNSGLYMTIGFDAMLLAFVIVFAGGIGSIFGAWVTAILVGLIQNLSLLVIDARWQSAVTFALLLAIVTVRPQGLFGKAD